MSKQAAAIFVANRSNIIFSIMLRLLLWVQLLVRKKLRPGLGGVARNENMKFTGANETFAVVVTPGFCPSFLQLPRPVASSLHEDVVEDLVALEEESVRFQ
ncbi:hypothetical protein MTO96_013549 [Rhipicephalus appendiculatus]